MKKQYNVNTSRFQFPFYGNPLVADNVNAYEIVLTVPEDITGCSFEVVATRADGEKFIGLGSCKGNTASYVMDNQMHAVVGELSVRVSVVDSDGSYLTTNELLFTVIKGNGSDHAAAGTNVGLLTQILVKISNVEKETDEKIARAKTETNQYSDEKLSEINLKMEKAVPTYHSYKKSLLVSQCCENAVSTNEISIVEYYEEYETNFCIYGNLSVDMHGSEYVFFNPETDVCFVAKLITSYPGDEKELDLHIEEDLSEMSLDEFKATYPFYGVYVQNKWEPVEVLFKQLEDGAKAYANEKANDAEKNAKAYATEKANVAEQNAKAYVDGEKTIVLPNRVVSGFYELPEDCIGLKSLIVTWDENITGADMGQIDLYSSKEAYYTGDVLRSFNYSYDDGLTQEIICEGFENRSDVKYIYVNNDVGETGLVSFTYYVKTKANAYTDNAIQQAILDSWEVGV